MTKIKAVIFDVGGTLVKVESTPKTFQEILKTHGIHMPIEIISKATEKAKEKLDAKRMAEIGPKFWASFNLMILEHLKIKDDVLTLAEAIDREWWDYAGVSLYPEAPAVLHKLRERKLKIGIISNSFKADLEKVLSKLNLKGFFDIEVTIDVAGKAKPDKEIFVYALEKLKVQPIEVLFVGDEFEADYEGALKAGLNTLLIDRENKIGKHVRKIRNLDEILRFI